MATGDVVARRVLAFLSEIGCVHGDVTVKSVEEPAVESIVEECGWEGEQSVVVADGSARTLLWDRLHRTAMWRAIQPVQQQVRVLKLALEDTWKMKVAHKHEVVPWIIEYSAFPVNRFEVGHDGKTAYE